MRKAEQLSTFIKLSGSLEERIQAATSIVDQDQLLQVMSGRTTQEKSVKVLANTVCNQQCRHCFYIEQGQSPYIVNREVIEDLRHVIDLMKPVDRLPRVYPREITLTENLYPIVQELEIDRVLSNGVLLSNEGSVERISSFGINKFAISLHGTREGHIQLTGVSESDYDRTLVGIQNAVDAGMDVSAFTTVYKGNVGTLHELFQLAGSLGIKEVNLIKLMPIGKAASLDDDYFLDEDDIKTLLFTVDEARKRTPNLKISLFGTSFGPNFYSGGIYRFLAGITDKNAYPYPCMWVGQHFLGVSLGTKDVYPCFEALSFPELKIGHVDDEGLHLTTPELSPESLTRNLKGGCSVETCSYHDLCLGGCRISAYSFAKKRGESDPLYAGADLCVTSIIEKMLDTGEIKIT